MRVTHVVFDMDGGGLETLVGALARAGADAGLQTSIVTLSGRQGRTGEAAARSVEHFHAVRPLRVVSLVAPVGLARVISRTTPDVVHLHSGAWFKPALAARLARVRRVVYTEHGREHADSPPARWLDRRAAGLTDLVVTVSRRLERYMRDVVGIRRTPIRTIDNGIDTRRFAPGASAALRDQLELPPNALIVGSVGRFEPVKAYHRAVEAVASLPAVGGRPVYLVLCGDGSLRPELEAAAARLGVADRLRLPGWVADPVPYYRLFDVFTLTSLSEGASVSLLEAMACGAAPVVMDVGANADLVGPALHHLVTPAGDLAAYRRVLEGTLASDGALAHARAAAPARVGERYSLERMVGAYRLAYEG